MANFEHFTAILAVLPVLLEIYDEVCEMKKACGTAHLKTILATGELGCLANVYKASMVCMMAGWWNSNITRISFALHPKSYE